VIPMFILVGEFVHYGVFRLALQRDQPLVRSPQRRTRHHDHHGVSCVLRDQRSNTATAATMSKVAIPSMKKYNYDPALNAGSVARGINPRRPHSPEHRACGVRHLHAAVDRQTLYGNIIPSIICTVLIGLTVSVICRVHPTWGPQSPRSSWSERFAALPRRSTSSFFSR
jgi:TRAP-type C4-dicarboxylate transport system permease large subunit